MARGARLEAATIPCHALRQVPPVTFVDVAKEAGVTALNVWGGVDHKRYIIEAKGSGLAFFDYDNDGWLDIYLTNGTRLDAQVGAREGADLAPVQKQSRRNIHGRYREIRTRAHRVADGRVRGRAA